LPRVPDRLELGCGKAPTLGYVHHDRAAHVDVAHDLDVLPWPWPDGAFTEILGLDVFEHLHLMPAAWLRECRSREPWPAQLEAAGTQRPTYPKTVANEAWFHCGPFWVPRWCYGCVPPARRRSQRPKASARRCAKPWHTNPEPQHKTLQINRLRAQSCVPTPVARNSVNPDSGAGIALGMTSGHAIKRNRRRATPIGTRPQGHGA
jgi:hypothetical protein